MAAPTGFGGSRELLKLISCFFRGSGWQSNLPSSSTEMTTPASMSLMLKSEKEQDVWWRVLHSGEEAVWTRFHLPSYLPIMFSGTVLSLFLSSSHPSSSAFYFSFDVHLMCFRYLGHLNLLPEEKRISQVSTPDGRAKQFPYSAEKASHTV